jgi:hypothetical protein
MKRRQLKVNYCQNIEKNPYPENKVKIEKEKSIKRIFLLPV